MLFRNLLRHTQAEPSASGVLSAEKPGEKLLSRFSIHPNPIVFYFEAYMSVIPSYSHRHTGSFVRFVALFFAGIQGIGDEIQ